MSSAISVDHNAIAKLCRQYGIERLSLFGSVLRPDFDPARSDVDVLIEFQRGASRSLFVIVNIQDDLQALFGRPVHVMTPGSISKYFRNDVLREAELQYVAA